MSARDEDSECLLCKCYKERFQFAAIRLGQHGEARDWTALAAVIRWRNSPNAAAPASQLPFLVPGVFLEPVGRIRDNRVHVIRGAKVHPLQAIHLVQGILDARNLALN